MAANLAVFNIDLAFHRGVQHHRYLCPAIWAREEILHSTRICLAWPGRTASGFGMSSLVGRTPAANCVWRSKPFRGRRITPGYAANAPRGFVVRLELPIRPGDESCMLQENPALLVTTSARAPGGEALVAMTLTKPKSRTSPHSLMHFDRDMEPPGTWIEPVYFNRGAGRIRSWCVLKDALF